MVFRPNDNIAPRPIDPYVVVVDHPNVERIAAIDEALTRCGVRAHHVLAASRVACRSDGCAIALVALAGQPPLRAGILDDVRWLKDNGYTVWCHAFGAGTWAPGVQCRLLLAGASQIFDSSATSFTSELSERMQDLLNADSECARESHRVQHQMRALGIVGSSAGLTGVFRWIVSASAVSDIPVLIEGETGTGKELAARALHRLDPRRRDRPFVAINCGAISAGLAESELFGHRRGAFTGAEHDRAGLIRSARGGVLFLDEIGDLELQLQGKLLRVLQEHRVLAVGDDREEPVDVRVVAATNRDLDAMVRQQTFREDLFHRLNVLSVRIPPLRSRPQDIEPLVEYFLRQCPGQQQHALSASCEFVEALRHLTLPGNVRQLENVIRRAALAARSGPLRLTHLPPELWQELSTEGAVAAGSSDEPATSSPNEHALPLDAVALLDASCWKLESALELCEQRLVSAALKASQGNRARAARLLGISPRCIFNKMRKHRLRA